MAGFPPKHRPLEVQHRFSGAISLFGKFPAPEYCVSTATAAWRSYGFLRGQSYSTVKLHSQSTSAEAGNNVNMPHAVRELVQGGSIQHSRYMGKLQTSLPPISANHSSYWQFVQSPLGQRRLFQAPCSLSSTLIDSGSDARVLTVRVIVVPPWDSPDSRCISGTTQYHR